MPPLSIPREHQVGLAKLRALPEHVASQLLSALGSASEKIRSAYFSPDDLPSVEGISREDLENILDSISGLYLARANAEVPVDEFIKDVGETVRSATHLTSPSSLPSIEEFEIRLAKFMGIAPLALTSKGHTLMYEHERTVYGLRILTDARPIFGDNVDEPPEAIEIMHTLKIAFHRGSQHEEEFFALDEIDLDELRQVVERAALKAKSLRAALRKTGMRVLREE